MGSTLLAIILALISLVGMLSGAIGAFAAQWYRSRQESPKLEAEKAHAEADKTAAEAWRALYNEVCERLETLEKKCEGLKSLVEAEAGARVRRNRLTLGQKIGQILPKRAEASKLSKYQRER